MRLIGKVENESIAERFSDYLLQQGIENSVYPDCTIWVHDDDKIDTATQLLEAFQQNPNDPKYTVIKPLDEEDVPEEIISPRRRAHFTSFIIAFCCMIYFFSSMQEIPILEKGVPLGAVPPPIQLTMFYDVPPALESLEKAVENYNPPPSPKPPPLPVDLEKQIAEVEATPYWHGLYDQMVLKLKGEDVAKADGPMFVKIREGEYWRLFSPALLHGFFLHLLFNMLWLWTLGKAIERNVGVFRYLLLTLILGVFSNTVQYLFTGPYFLGYSGIILGLAGFIWMRKRMANWEYSIHPTMIYFLGVFVLAMFALQVGAFLVTVFTTKTLPLNIANAGHLSGALLGIVLGRLNFFERRPL